MPLGSGSSPPCCGVVELGPGCVWYSRENPVPPECFLIRVAVPLPSSFANHACPGGEGGEDYVRLAGRRKDCFPNGGTVSDCRNAHFFLVAKTEGGITRPPEGLLRQKRDTNSSLLHSFLFYTTGDFRLQIVLLYDMHIGYVCVCSPSYSGRQLRISSGVCGRIRSAGVGHKQKVKPTPRILVGSMSYTEPNV